MPAPQRFRVIRRTPSQPLLVLHTSAAQASMLGSRNQFVATRLREAGPMQGLNAARWPPRSRAARPKQRPWRWVHT